MEQEKIDKIVQLDIDLDGYTDEELEEFGVEVISLVEDPAIGVNFMTFSDEEFESYTDYPKAASANAQRALDWAEENGWGSCGTAVGKRRANQLANREPISRETIARMSAFRRQEGNKDTPYGEGCGGLMWDAWGGDEGIAWAARKLEQIDNEELEFSEEAQEALIEFAEDNGTYLTADDVIVDLNNKEFATVSETVEAIRGLDLLKRLSIPEYTEAETFYRYQGPPAERRFCKAMVNLSKAGKIFSRKEIAKMNSINSQFAKRGQSSYSIFKYKGGKNCKHYWEQLKVFKGEGLGKIVIVEKPTTSIQETAGTRWANLQFSIDDEKRIVSGPAMIPNKMIPRRNEQGEPYYIFFSKETIRKMAERFFKLNKHNNTDRQHDWQITQKNTLLESWISEDQMYDKAYKMGFALPQGTWYLSYKINDEETWKEIKEGKIKGFSLAGGFIEKLANDRAQQAMLTSIKEIIKQIDND